MEIFDHSLFRVTRDTDYDVSDEADDLMQAVEEELRRRRFGEVVRLEVERGMSPRLRSELIRALRIEERQVYEVDGLLDLDDLWDIAGVKGFGELRYPAFSGVTQPRLQGEDGEEPDVIAAMREQRHPRPPSLRLVLDLGRALRASRPWRTPTCSRSSRPCTGRAPTRRSSRP